MKKEPRGGDGNGRGGRGQRQDVAAGAANKGPSQPNERNKAKGAPAGANQGGAPRGGSRVEPSHQQRTAKHARLAK